MRKVPEARVVKPSHQLVEESEQLVAQALGRELRVPVLAEAEAAFVCVIGLPVDRNARELRERRHRRSRVGANLSRYIPTLWRDCAECVREHARKYLVLNFKLHTLLKPIL